MFKHFRIAWLIFALALVACAPVAPAVMPSPVPPTPTPAPPTPSPVPTEAKAATVMVASSEQLGSFLVGPNGMTLYIFLKDTPNTSNCYDACAQNWPPLLVEGAPVAGEGVDASLLGVTQRQDGTTQVTYNGWPLYYFAGDEKPGDTNGQGVRDVWFVISPQGEKISMASLKTSG